MNGYFSAEYPNYFSRMIFFPTPLERCTCRFGWEAALPKWMKINTFSPPCWQTCKYIIGPGCYDIGQISMMS